ncbi:MAG: hypothetical protein MSG64_17530 [Pyrinomonadaceae bacterium MAG19_C2-C3]|nr:hypothetical protein [Pyrinomonadaceae bacterium MAG19_C2-C3]
MFKRLIQKIKNLFKKDVYDPLPSVIPMANARTSIEEEHDQCDSAFVPMGSVLETEMHIVSDDAVIERDDERSSEFQMGKQLSAIEPDAPTPPRRWIWRTGEVLAQPDDESCVAHAFYQLLLSEPKRQRPALTPVELHKKYLAEDAKKGGGTSILTGARVLKREGYLPNYYWAANAAEVVKWLQYVGPVVIGVFMHEGMRFYQPVHGDYFLRATRERSMGAHALLVHGYDLDMICPDGTTGAVRLCNSWGAEFMCGGKAWLSIADLDFLLGERTSSFTPRACAPMEVIR